MADASVHRTQQQVEILTPDYNNWCQHIVISVAWAAKFMPVCILDNNSNTN